MKAEAELKTASLPASLAKAADFLELTKPRIAVMVLVTTLAGFYMASAGAFDLPLLAWTLLGTALTASGASAFNQVIERQQDALMLRTRNRPLPAGRITPAEANTFGAVTGVIGLAVLAAGVNPLAALIAVLTFASYVVLYTPLKRVTPMNTAVGAIPGALPPLIGWAAAANALPLPAWTLFAILFFWQIPHFMAIAWLYRGDYARGGFKMISLGDDDGRKTARQMIGQSFALVAVSMLPSMYGLVGQIYSASALVLGVAFCGFAVYAAWEKTNGSARALLLASVVYLPLLFIAMMVDKAPLS